MHQTPKHVEDLGKEKEAVQNILNLEKIKTQYSKGEER